MKGIGILCILTILLVACGPTPEPVATPDAVFDNNVTLVAGGRIGTYYGLYRVIDAEAKMVCYLAVNCGMVCVPSSQTALDVGR